MTNSRSTMNYTPSTDFISNEIKFLIACCQTEASEEDIEFINSYLSRVPGGHGDTAPTEKIIKNDSSRSSLNAERLELNALIRLANQHGILPLVYKSLKRLSENHPSLVPGGHGGTTPTKKIIENLSQNDDLNATRLTLNAFLSDLKSKYMQIVQRNMLMSAELVRIIHLLKRNNIEALAFKGPTLSQTAYGDITLRQFGDLDILIKGSDIYPMIDLLLSHGYTPTLDFDTSMKDTFIHALNVLGFYKSTTNTLMEVHWKLLSKNYAITWNEEALWAQKKNVVNINGTDIPIIPFEQQLLYLCIHSAKHLFERLEWVCDIDRSIRSNPNIDWSYLVNEAKEMGIERMLYLGLALCQYFFRLELPESIQENIKKDSVLQKLLSKIIKANFSEPAQTGKSYRSFGLLLNMRENFSDKLRFTWFAFFAPKFDDFLFIKLPKYMVWLYPFIRPYRLLRKYF